MSTKRSPRLRFYLRYDANLQVIPGSGVLRYHMPRVGKWKDATDFNDLCCNKPAYLIVCNTNTNSQTITNISYGDNSIDLTLAVGQCYTVEIPEGTSVVTVTNDAVASQGRMTAEVVSGAGSITPSCQDSTSTYTLSITAHAGDQFIASLETNTSCTTTTTSTTTTTTTTTP